MRTCSVTNLSRKRLALLIVSVAAALPATASNLESNNPFLPPGYNNKPPEPKPVTPAPVRQNGPLSREIEFRGFVKFGNQYQFGIKKKNSDESFWLTEGQASESGIQVRGFDLDSKSITISMNGRSERISLSEDAGSSSPLPVAGFMPPGHTTSSIATPKATVTNTTSPAKKTSKPRRRVITRRRAIVPTSN